MSGRGPCPPDPGATKRGVARSMIVAWRHRGWRSNSGCSRRPMPGRATMPTSSSGASGMSALARAHARPTSVGSPPSYPSHEPRHGRTPDIPLLRSDHPPSPPRPPGPRRGAVPGRWISPHGLPRHLSQDARRRGQKPLGWSKEMPASMPRVIPRPPVHAAAPGLSCPREYVTDRSSGAS